MVTDEQLTVCWRDISVLLDKQLASSVLMHQWAKELEDVEPISAVYDRLIAEYGRERTGIVLAQAMERARRMQRVRQADREIQDSTEEMDGQLVSRADFDVAFDVLLHELRAVAKTWPGAGTREMLVRFLRNDPHTLSSAFGSRTLAWDELVVLKQRTSIADERRSRQDAWFVATVGVTERFLREILTTAILHCGKDLLRPVLIACTRDRKLNMPPIDVDKLTTHETINEYLSKHTLDHIDRGAWYTTNYAEAFFRGLDVDLFSAPESAFQILLAKLPVDADSPRTAWASILELRKAVVHDTAVGRTGPTHRRRRKVLYGLSGPERLIVVDFLCALSFLFAANMLRGLQSQIEEVGKPVPTHLAYKFSGELRVNLMTLLRRERYELASAMAEIGLTIEPPSFTGRMLRINSLCARLRLGEATIEEAKQIETGGAPRYELIKSVLSGDLRQSVIQPLLLEVLESKNLTSEELLTWPALDDLRRASWWAGWASHNLKLIGNAVPDNEESS